MDNNSINGSVRINAQISKIWDTLTNPNKIILYTGSTTQTDWKIGSPIIWSGEIHGIKYENKGEILENNPNIQLRYTYWSGMGGDADLLENYSEITYTLKKADDNSIELTYSRIKIATEIETQIFQSNLQAMLNEIKKLSEQ